MCMCVCDLSKALDTVSTCSRLDFPQKATLSPIAHAFSLEEAESITCPSESEWGLSLTCNKLEMM